jgi:hypothetical protein
LGKAGLSRMAIKVRFRNYRLVLKYLLHNMDGRYITQSAILDFVSALYYSMHNFWVGSVD